MCVCIDLTLVNQSFKRNGDATNLAGFTNSVAGCLNPSAFHLPKCRGRIDKMFEYRMPSNQQNQ